MNGEELLRPLLTKYPDARRSQMPLVEPLFLPYVALILGSALASLLAAFNAVMLRRAGLAAQCLALGVAGWVGTRLLMLALLGSGISNPGLLLLGVRLLQFAIGGLLYAVQRRHIRGHEQLSGLLIPVQLSYVIAFVAGIYLPWRLVLALLGVPT